VELYTRTGPNKRLYTHRIEASDTEIVWWWRCIIVMIAGRGCDLYSSRENCSEARKKILCSKDQRVGVNVDLYDVSPNRPRDIYRSSPFLTISAGQRSHPSPLRSGGDVRSRRRKLKQRTRSRRQRARSRGRSESLCIRTSQWRHPFVLRSYPKTTTKINRYDTQRRQ